MGKINIITKLSLLKCLDSTAETRANLVASAARDTGSVYPGGRATVEVAGNGYQVQLPGCADAGFEEGDNAPVLTALGLLLIHDGAKGRLAEDLVAIRARN